MQVTINGKTEIIQARTVDQLVAQKNLDAASLVVEHNQQIVKQAQWSSIHLRQGDCLELLNFVGGG